MTKLLKVLLVIGMTGIVHAKQESIVFAAGCFWGVEKHFEQMDGVIEATSGYAGGNYPNPSYETVLKYRFDTPKNIVNHTESVKVVFDTDTISAGGLIREFWELHDPTQGDRQGNDRGNNYRSAIFYTTGEQQRIALETKAAYQTLLTQAGYQAITTEIRKLERFYAAEPYHQDYLKNHPHGYCPNHTTGVTFQKKPAAQERALKPLGGKEIIVIDADGCPFCEQFKKDVLASYRGDTTLRVSRKENLEGFQIKTNLNATPTILFIEDGKELFAHRGYMNTKDFYKVLGAFKLGNGSEAYNVAFNQGTDGRFCKQYNKFKNTGDGVFVDTLSGDLLFDTRDRFNSHSGWLSFYKAVEGSTIQKEDNSYGMRRTEVIAKKSGIHLGHVFDDAPGGRKRFCINATVLRFIPRSALK